MARIKDIEHRLDNWALWKEREATGSMGWSTRSSLLRDPGGQGGYRESTIPILDEEAAITDLAVDSLKPDRLHLHQTLLLHYIGAAGQPRLSVIGIAKALGCQVSTIRARFDEADRALAQWFSMRAEATKPPTDTLPPLPGPGPTARRVREPVM